MNCINRKGQLNAFQGAILSLVVIGILLGAAFLIMAEFQAEAREKNTAGTAVNESVTSSPTTGLSATLAAASLVDGSCGTITGVFNGTGGIAIGVGNFTQVGCGVTNKTAMTTYTTALLFNYPYTYSADTTASNATGNVSTALEKIPNMLGLVVLIIVIGVILAIVFAVIPTRTA